VRSDPEIIEATPGPSWAVSLRAILAVLVGYVIYSSGIIAFFALSGREKHGHHALSFLVLSAVVGLLYAAFAGYLCVAMIGRGALGPALALAVLIAFDAVVSFEYVPHGGSAWHQILAMVLFAPAAIAGGALAVVEGKRRRPQG
jgi:sorbitol-specific phosphotransferase system component IIBC